MNPLAPFDRQDPCWCGSGKTYRLCHKKFATPRHPPGAPVPPDDDESISLSPDVRLARTAVPSMMPAGTPITMPPSGPAARPLGSTAFERAVAQFDSAHDSKGAQTLGRARVHLLRKLARLRDGDARLGDNYIEEIASFAVEAWKTSTALRQVIPRRTILWNEELAATTFIGRTLLLADHVLYPDAIMSALSAQPTVGRIRDLAIEELRLQHLIRAGHVLPMPDGVAQYIRNDAIVEATDTALANETLVQFIRSQLVIEGPSAREVLFINAIDDLDSDPGFWFHAHSDLKSSNEEDRSITFRMLQDFDPNYDYSAWIKQVTDSALSKFVQRTERRLAVADVLGAEYVAAAPFEARILQRRSGRTPGIADATLWAGVPTLADLTAKDLARMLSLEDAVEDLRAHVRNAMDSAPDFDSQASAIRSVAADIERASKTLTKRMRTSSALSITVPVVSGGLGLAVGSAGGVFGFAGAALALIGGVSPAVADRLNQRREAAFLFTMPRRRRA